MKRNTTTSGNQRERGMGGQKDYEQEKGTGKRQVLGMMEEMHSGRRYLEE